MARTRTTTAELDREGLDAVCQALRGTELSTRMLKEPGRSALLEVTLDDRAFVLAVEAVSVCTPARARDLVDFVTPASPALPALVADTITTQARALLTEAGWSWFDRRGALHLRAPGVRIDLEVPAMPRRPLSGTSVAIAGRAGITVAYWLCAHLDRTISSRRQAIELGVAPSTISRVTTALAGAGLLDGDRRPVMPELFWELVDVWPGDRHWVLGQPHPQAAGPDAPPWRRTGTAAAAAYGAPVVTAGEGSVELYVGGPVELSIATRRYGAAEPGAGAAALAVAPTRLALPPLDDGKELMVGEWPAAPLLAVALDLAKDRGRGREILQDWEIGDGIWR